MTNSAVVEAAPALDLDRQAVAPTRPRPVNARVRPLVEDDLEGVADLFLQRFRAKRRSPRARCEVAAYMKALYLDEPGCNGEASSLVTLDDAGGIAAFVGCNSARFLLDGRPVKVGVTGTFMASSSPGQALAAVQNRTHGCTVSGRPTTRM